MNFLWFPFPFPTEASLPGAHYYLFPFKIYTIQKPQSSIMEHVCVKLVCTFCLLGVTMNTMEVMFVMCSTILWILVQLKLEIYHSISEQANPPPDRHITSPAL